MDISDARRLKPEAQQALRRQAIRLCKKGMKQREIAESLGVYPTTVSKWWRAYKKDGAKAIRCKKRGRPHGSCRTLTPDQEVEVQRLIYDKCPDQLNLAFTLWTRIAVQQLIRQRWSVEMPIRTVGEYLRRWGFTADDPLIPAHRQNPEAAEKWFEEAYPEIKKRARQEKAVIHWGDVCGRCCDRSFDGNHAGRDRPAATLRPSGCDRVHVISSVTNQGKVHFMICRDQMRSRRMIQFMERLVKGTDRKVFLIFNNLSVHHRHAVRHWLQEHADQIEIFFLPSHSPERNPGGNLDSDLKAGVRSGVAAGRKNQLQKKDLLRPRKLQRVPGSVKTSVCNGRAKTGARV